MSPRSAYLNGASSVNQDVRTQTVPSRFVRLELDCHGNRVERGVVSTKAGKGDTAPTPGGRIAVIESNGASGQPILFVESVTAIRMCIEIRLVVHYRCAQDRVLRAC